MAARPARTVRSAADSTGASATCVTRKDWRAGCFVLPETPSYDEYRRVARDPERLDAAPDEQMPAYAHDWTDEQSGVLTELSGCLRPLLGELTPAYRRALQLTDLDGRSQVSAARIEGISVSGMKSRVQRGRRQLADLLGRCCTLALDARGMPMGYTPASDCRCDRPADQTSTA